MNEIQKLLQTGRVYQNDQGEAAGVMLPVSAIAGLQKIGFRYEELKNEKEEQGK